MTEKKKSILLVEDNCDHIELIKKILVKGSLDVNIFSAIDGEDALNFVFRKGKYRSVKNLPSPDLIVLDIKLPKIDGYQVLKTIKADKIFRSIPIIVLSTSAREEDIQRMYRCGANEYITKPSQYHEFIAICDKVRSYLTKNSCAGEKG